MCIHRPTYPNPTCLVAVMGEGNGEYAHITGGRNGQTERGDGGEKLTERGNGEGER